MVLGVPLTSSEEVILLLQSHLVRVQQFPLQLHAACSAAPSINPSHLEAGLGAGLGCQNGRGSGRQ